MGQQFSNIAFDPTVVSNVDCLKKIQIPDYTTAIQSLQIKKNKNYNWAIGLGFFAIVAMTAWLSYLGCYIVSATIDDNGCTESIYMLSSGQHVACNDPHSRVDIVANTTSNITFICKCNMKHN